MDFEWGGFSSRTVTKEMFFDPVWVPIWGFWEHFGPMCVVRLPTHSTEKLGFDPKDSKVTLLGQVQITLNSGQCE